MERIKFQDAPKGLYDSMYQMGAYIDGSCLNPKFLKLMDYRVSQINGCAYCLDMHFKEALHAGETQLRLSSVSAWQETPYFSEKERAALAFAEALTQLDQNEIGDDVYQPMKQNFSDEEIAYLTLAIVKINGWNRLMKAFKIEPGKYQVGMHE